MRGIDLQNVRFGKLVAIELVERGKRRKWRCKCDCGNAAVVDASNLRSGNSTACGKCRCPTRGGLRHGHTAAGGIITPTYRSWIGMRARCRDQKRENYRRYGGRGISYDPRWDDFTVFLADMGECPPGMTLDRIDNDKGYTKENCRWATATQQTRNRRIARTFTFEGRTMPIVEWAKELGLTYSTVVHRVNRFGSLRLPSDED